MASKNSDRPTCELVLDALLAAGALTPEQHHSATAMLREMLAAEWDPVRD